MVDSAFVETSVYIGYCITVDEHHENCADYVDGDSRSLDSELVSTERVRNEYYRAKNSVIDRYTGQLHQHRQRVTRFLRSSPDPLDLPALEDLKTQTLDSGMGIRDFMIDFYEGIDYIYHDELVDELRTLTREIESLPRSRIDTLDDLVECHDPQDTYEDIEEKIVRDPLFEDMEREDRLICLEAHDHAVEDRVDVEFATANSSDFCDDGRDSRLKELTELFEIRNLSA